MMPRASVPAAVHAGLVALGVALVAAGCGSPAALVRRGGERPPVAPASTARSTREERREVADELTLACERAARRLAADSLPAAEAELRSVLKRSPGYAPAMALLSQAWFRSGRHAEAVELLRPVLVHPEAYGRESRRALLEGLALHEDALGRTTEARGALAAARALDDDATSADVFVVLRGESPDSATALARSALRRDGRSAVNLNNFGITRLRAGDLEGARRAFADAMVRDPELPGPYYNLAILEKFYRFDDNAAARWFGEYWNRSHADPDSLRPLFAPRLAGIPGGGAR